MTLSCRKIFHSPLFLTGIVLLILLSSFSIYSLFLYRNLKDGVISRLSEASSKTAVALKNQINGEQRAIEDVAFMISIDKRPLDEFINTLQSVCTNHQLLRMGIITLDGKALTTDGKVLYLSMRPYFHAAFQGKSSVSDRLIDVVDGKVITVYAAPIYDSNRKNVSAVLFGTYSIERFQTSLSMPLFEGKGYAYIVKENGDAISASSNNKGESDFDNILQMLEELSPENTYAVADLREGMQKKANGYIEFNNKYKNTDNYMYYAPLGINGWYLLTVVPFEVLNKRILFVLSLTFILGCIIFAVCYFILSSLLKAQKKARITLEEILFVNKITGNCSYEKFKIDAKNVLNKKRPDEKYALVSVDIDKFKYINDMFSYKEGDNLIRFVDNVFLTNCRSDELTAHISADNFILLLRYETKESLCSRLEILYDLITEYKHDRKQQYEISLSIGIYEIHDTELEVDIDVMRDRAEIPRKQIVSNKNSVYAFYDEAVRKKILMEFEMENSMNAALLHNEFVIMYQPKFSVSDRTLSGAEALVRWKRNDGTTLNPAVFIPLFEENGFITLLDKYVFTLMCKDIKRWMEQSYNVVPISSNLSRKNIGIVNLAEEYDAIVNSFGIPKKLTALELTETAFIENEDVIGDFIQKLRGKGFSVILDDFGTGFSSLGLLIHIDIDMLKIDRSFTIDIDKNMKSHSILHATIKLMRQWNVRVNAEGVETLEQFECLKQLHCDEVQGYYFSKPLPPEEFEKLMTPV